MGHSKLKSTGSSNVEYSEMEYWQWKAGNLSLNNWMIYCFVFTEGNIGNGYRI